MIIFSKLADYGVIIASHLAAHPERQMTAATLATETRLPRATVAKILKALAHSGIVAGARGAAGGYRLARAAKRHLRRRSGRRDRRRKSASPNAQFTRPHASARSSVRRARIGGASIEIVGTALSAVFLAEMVPVSRTFLTEPAARASDIITP